MLLCCWACGIASTVVKNGESAQAIYTAIAPRTFLNTLQVPGMVCIARNLYKHGHQSLHILVHPFQFTYTIKQLAY